MPRIRDDFEDDIPPRRRRETIMERRLRVARGEIDPEMDTEDEDLVPFRSGRPIYAPSRSGTGCAQATLYIVIGGLAALLIVLFFFGSMLSGVGSVLSRGPQLPVIVASPTLTIRTNAAVIQRLQRLNRLETTSYTVETVIEAGIEGNIWEDLLFGDRLLLIAHGTVVAGIDLSELGTEDIVISPDGARVQLTLPPVRIFNVTLDNSRTRVYDRQQGLLAPTNKDLETEARQAAERKIIQSACEGNIIQQATEDSQRAMEQFLSLLDFQQVEVVASPGSTCTVTSPTSPVPTTP